MINKIGIIFCAYGNPSYIEKCIEPWLKLKDKYDILISAVHGQFKEYHENDVLDVDTETLDELIYLKDINLIDNLYIQNYYWDDKPEYIYQTEAEIRNKGLEYFKDKDRDVIWLLDLDEFYTIQEIENIINYINKPENDMVAWFGLNFKNYIFDGKQWIDGFCPPRIFKINYTNLIIKNFYYDNDLIYKDKSLEIEINYKYLPSVEIPTTEAHIKHLTWLHSNGKSKVEYQLSHFGHCSYKWNDEKKELELDVDFYKKNRLNLPIIYKDE